MQTAVLMILSMLYLMDYERIYKTQDLVLATTTGKKMMEKKMLAGTLCGLFYAGLLTVFTLLVFFAAVPFQNLWHVPVAACMVAEPRLQMMYPFVTFWWLEQWRYLLLALVVLVGLLGIVAAVTAADISRQIKALKGGATIIIGTPGRVMDHLRRKTIRCDYINTIVLDEADEMLSVGFREDIETILSYIPDEDRQTVLFSATMPKPILEITRKFQHDATTIKVTKKELTVPNIDQYYYDVRRNDKMEVLTRLLDYYNPKLSLVFCNTKRMVDELASELQGRGYAAEGIHGDMKQVQRDRVMKKFRNGKTDILIATDVAARGIDVDDVEAVFNYDLPQDNEYYVHRIGRTGRAGRTGKAFNFVKGKEVYKLKEIQRYCKTKIKAQPIPSSDDVAAIKADKILDGIGQIIEDGDLRDMIELIEQQVNNSDYTAMDIAAAFLKQAIGGVELSKEDHEFDDALAGDTGAEEGMVRLFINIGKSQRIRPGDILGAVAGEAKIPGKLVGAIDMYDNYTFVEVPQEYGKDVLKAMKNVKIKGKSVNVEPANAR